MSLTPLQGRTRTIIPVSHMRKLCCRKEKSLTRGQMMSIKRKRQDQTVGLLTCVWARLIHSTAPSQIPKAGRHSQELPSFQSHPGLSNLGWGQGLKRVGVAESGGGSKGHLVLNHGRSGSWGQVPIKQSGCENPVISPPGSPRIPRAAVAGSNTEIVKQLLRKW